MSNAADLLPGESVERYEVTDRRDSDYYAVFADIPGPDRAAWDRARGYVDEVAPLMREAWDRAEYPLDAATKLESTTWSSMGSTTHPSPTSPRSLRGW